MSFLPNRDKSSSTQTVCQTNRPALYLFLTCGMSAPLLVDSHALELRDSGSQVKPPTRAEWEEEVFYESVSPPRSNLCIVWLSELISIIQLVVPVIITYGADFLINIVQLMFVGHIGSTEMAGAALAASYCNVTGYSVIIGLLSAMDTLTSQAYGANKPRQIGVTVQQSVVVVILYSILVLPLWVFSDEILLLLGQDEQVVEFASLFIRISWLALPPYGIYCIMRRYLQNQNITLPLMASGGFALFANTAAFAVALLILDMGFLGVPVALVVAVWSVMLFMGLILVIFFRQKIRDTWSPWSLSNIRGIGVWLKIAIPGMMMFCANLWGMEINIFLAGIIGTTELAAMTLVLNVQSSFYTIPMSIGISATTKVGNAVGAGNESQAKRVGRIIVMLAFTAQLVVVTITYMSRSVWPYLFTSDEEVVDLVVVVVPVLCAFSLLDATQTSIAGIFRGVGKQTIGAVAYLFSYYVVGLPISICLALVLNMGLVGQWFGLTCAAGSSLILLSVAYLFMDWSALILEARARVEKQQQNVLRGDVREVDSDNVRPINTSDSEEEPHPRAELSSFV